MAPSALRTDSQAKTYRLRDFVTKEEVTPDNLVFTGVNPWEVEMDLDRVKQQINWDYFSKAPPRTSKYLPLMPVSDYEAFNSLGSGATPLIKSISIGPALGVDVYFKLESQNPTGSFKDRGSAVEIATAREYGAKGMVVASTGSMAASVACYAANAHIPCFVFVPEGTPQTKLAQVIAYGGRVVQVKGNYGQTAALAQKVAAELGFYLAGDYAFRVEGAKTAAFELIEQLFFRLPHFVVIPMGCGTNLAAYYKGFREYQALGFTHRIPKLIGVQATGAPTIVRSFEQGIAEPTTLDHAETVARAICINHALDGRKALDALYATEGEAYALTDSEMLEAQYRLSKEEGLFVEPSCAATIASLAKLSRKYNLKDKRIVCVLPGTGLKDPSSILRIAIKPPSIDPDIKDFLTLYKHSYFESKTVSLFKGSDVIFPVVPSRDEVQQSGSKLLNVTFSNEHGDRSALPGGRFVEKGRLVTLAEFQDIVQGVMESRPEAARRTLQIVDFSVEVKHDQPAQGWVKANFGGKLIEGTGSGVGPIDAVVDALASGAEGSLDFELVKFSVEVRGAGANAAVFVEALLKRGETTATGTGTSPDIVQASLEAIENAFNLL